jgi:regulator of sigma E protease
VNWLPLGGFVKFVGEIQAPQDTHAVVAGPVGRPYTQLGPMKRLAVSLGGPFANFLFAIVVFAGLGFALGVPQAREVSISAVEANSPAAKAGMRVGDVMVAAAGRPVQTSDDVMRATALSAGEPVAYRVRRDGEIVDLTATPVEVRAYNEQLKMNESLGRIGVAMAHRDVQIRRLNPIEAVGYGAAQTIGALDATVNVLRRLVTGKEGLDKLSGPLGIFTVADNGTDLHLKQEGVSLDKRLMGAAIWLIQLSALLSIGVGFFNLLPIPVLDGGAAVMCIAEAVTGREVPEKVQRVGLTIGLACLVSFALVITWQDITRLPLWSGAP